MPTLAELRKKLQDQDTRRSGNFNSGPSDNYPFWNIPNDVPARVRFLPDADPDNTFFWVEKNMIRLTFPGIKGDDEKKEVAINVPCMEMYGETCPILTETRPWWNDDSLKELARKYWKKRNYIFQGFVQEDPMAADEQPESPIRRFTIGAQIFKLIKASLLDPDFDNIPTDYINGTDFIITKTQKGDWADYTTSKWARKESALTQEQLDAIETHGTKNLNDYLPAKPTPAHLNAIFEMFEASVEGGLYEPKRWAQYYKPFGLEWEESASTTTPAPTSTPAVTVTTETAVETDDIPFDVPEKKEPVVAESATSDAEPTKSAEDILAMIRNRNN